MRRPLAPAPRRPRGARSSTGGATRHASEWAALRVAGGRDRGRRRRRRRRPRRRPAAGRPRAVRGSRSRPRGSTAAPYPACRCPGRRAPTGAGVGRAPAGAGPDPAGVPGRSAARGVRARPPPTASRAPTPRPAWSGTPRCGSPPCRQPAEPQDHLPGGRRPRRRPAGCELRLADSTGQRLEQAHVARRRRPGGRPAAPRPARPGRARRRPATSPAKSGRQAVERGDHRGGQHDRRARPCTSPSRSTVAPTTPSSTTLTVSVTGRTPTTTRPRVDGSRDALGDEGRRRHRAQRVVEHERLAGVGDPTTDGRSTAVTPASPSAHAAQATSASPWISANGSDPRSSTHGPSAGAAHAVHGCTVMVRSAGATTALPPSTHRGGGWRRGPRGRTAGASGAVRTDRLRRRAPRRGWPPPCPRWCARPAPARRPGSGAPWPASASRRPTGRGHARGATGRGRPRPPS